MRDRDEEIRQQEVQNLTGSRHLEAQKLKQLLTERNLAVFEVGGEIDFVLFTCLCLISILFLSQIATIVRFNMFC